MSSKATISGILICALALFAVLEYGHAATGTTSPSVKVGIVSVRGIFKKSQKHGQYSAQMAARLNQARAQLEQLAKEADAEEAGLKVLKKGTADYMQQLNTVLAKRAELQHRQEFLKQQQTLESKQWTEAIYEEVLAIVKEIGKEKGLDLVLERTEPDFPISSEELMLTLSTHQVLYDAGCIDLTDEVAARVDASENLKP